jgi:hypothetical protein
METQLPEAYALLLARILTLEAELDNMREVLADVREHVKELEMRA